MIALTAAALIGLAGSLHCAGMCGPLMLLLGRMSRGVAMGWTMALYHAGRLLSYTLLGLLAGGLPAWVGLASHQQWLSIASGLLLVAVALAGSRWRGRKWIAVHRLVNRLSAWALRCSGWQRLIGMGMVNGLLPCGLVYAALAVAAAGGNALTGAAVMLLFGIGTLPVLLAMTLTSGMLPVRRWWRPSTLRLLTLAAGLLLVLRGMNLNIPLLSPSVQEAVVRCEHCTVK
ncbi:MAG: sulfite exporter TauE/SafE family protein [Chitinophagales bacterium]|nr:sulfite exporter TauE/SafE family protein [Chitinophagales bacterium]MDW8394440.1 sulfite exporter TauE/SafE family protein [Chitinophagales bacterium]